jgi:hypothetical protein
MLERFISAVVMSRQPSMEMLHSCGPVSPGPSSTKPGMGSGGRPTRRSSGLAGTLTSISGSDGGGDVDQFAAEVGCGGGAGVPGEEGLVGAFDLGVRRQRILGPEDIRALPRGTALSRGTALLLATGTRAARIRLMRWYDGPDAATIRHAAADAERLITERASHDHR